MYLLKSVPAQSHCSKHVEVFFDNLFTIYEEYSSPKSIWQKHFKHHIRLFLPALYILKVIFLLLNQTLHITAHTQSLICHASLTDSVYRSIHGSNDQQLLLAITQYNKLHTTEPAGYNNQQLLLAKLDTTNSTPLNQLVLLLYYGVPPYGEIILKKENTWKQCITWVLCINCITWATIVQHLNPLPVYLHITNATWNKSRGKWNWD